MTATATTPVSVEDPSAPPPKSRRPKMPRFGLAIPSWVWYLGFFIVPVLVVVWYSFGYKPPVTAGQGPIGTDRLSLDNYREALSDTFFTTFRNTLRVAITGTLLCLFIGFPVAYFIAVKMPAKWRGLMLALVIIPFWTSFLIRTIAWRIVLAPEGWLSHFLQTVGLRETPIRFLDTREAVQLGVVYNYLPLMIFPLFVALDRLDPALREASKDLGASRVKTFLQVTLPLAAPGMIAGLLLVFIPLAGDYITASVLGGAKGNMAGALVASPVPRRAELGAGVRDGGCADLHDPRVHRDRRRHRPCRSRSDAQGQGDRRRSTGASRHAGGSPDMTAAIEAPPSRGRRFDFVSWGLGVWTVLVIVFLFIPIGFVVAHSFNSGNALLVWQGFSTEWYSSLFDNDPLVQAIRNSLKVAVGSTLIAVVLGGTAGVALARRGGKWNHPFMAIVFLILVTPEIVDAIAYLIWFVRIGGPFDDGFLFLSSGEVRLFVGHSLFSSAVVTLIVRGAPSGPRRIPRGSRRGSRCNARTRVSSDHVAVDVPRTSRGRAVGVHVQSRQHHRLDVRQHRGVDDPAGVRLLGGAVGDQARHRRGGDVDARADPRLPGVRRVRVAPRR